MSGPIRDVRASDVSPEDVEWLLGEAEPMIPKRGITILAGRRGATKTTLSCWLAARATAAGINVFFASAEDDVASVVLPRMAAAAADLERVFFPDEAGVPLRFPIDAGRLDRHVSFIAPGDDDCWVWLGSRSGEPGTEGYGTFSVDGEMLYAHRFSYEQSYGCSIPAGMHIDHLCRNRGCVNPRHLEVVTPRENVLRGEGPAARNHKKTHCKHGHELTEENTYRTPDGRRRCRECGRVRNRRDYRKRQARQHGEDEGGRS